MKLNTGLVIVTTACPIECEHCQYSCTIDGEWMSETVLLKFIQECRQNKVEKIHVSGGEPFLDMNKLKRALDIITKYYLPRNISVATSGFWAVNTKETLRILKIIGMFNLKHIALSFDRFHLRKIPISYIKNILKISSEIGIHILLRPALDKYSYDLFAPLQELVKDYNTDILFSYTDPFGRGELLGDDMLSSTNRATEQFKAGLGKFTGRMSNPQSNSITLFPNGNVYGCCIAMKLTYMGNIQTDNLDSMLEKYKRTLPGHAFLNKGSCSYLKNFLPSQTTDRCDFCRNQPFNKKILSESVGREYMVVKNLNEIPQSSRELLLAFEIEDLSLITGKKIIKFLETLKQKKQRFSISRPLPRCIFGKDYNKYQEKYSFPRTCYDCNELFTVQNGCITFCHFTGYKKGSRLDEVANRDDIYQQFKLIKPKGKCNTCIHFKRNRCSGVC